MRKDNPKRVDRSKSPQNSKEKSMRAPHERSPHEAKKSSYQTIPTGRDGGGEGGTSGNWGGGATRGTEEEGRKIER
jgi:hypothetical protein